MNQPLSYKDAGVDIDAGDALVERIKPYARKTLRPGVLAGIGGFGALFEVPKHYRERVMVSGTDGVGTKLKLAFEWNMHDTVGIDLVGMSVNDILVQGAEPLFFLDYFACGQLHVDTAAQVVAGIAQGCEASGCALIGGETAEMPGMYPAGEYDLAGFAVGVVEKSEILDGRHVRAGDAVEKFAKRMAVADRAAERFRVLNGLGEKDRLTPGDLVVHIFQPEEREFYRLERLWGDAERLELPREPVEFRRQARAHLGHVHHPFEREDELQPAGKHGVRRRPSRT